MKLFKTIYIIVLVIVLVTGSTYAGTTGKIAGVIIDEGTGEGLAGANIYLDGYYYGAASDEEGYYYILNIPPGTYTVVTQMIGYTELRTSNVKVQVDLTTNLNCQLKPTALEASEVINVVAERPLIENDVTSSSISISSDEIESLPVDNYNELLTNQAGVIDQGGELHFRGGRGGEVAYMVDGIPVNDPYNNRIGVEVENTSIQQLEVISGTFNAEYGQAMSGVVNIVTKEGSQDYELDVSSYISNYLTNHTKIFPNLDNLNSIGSKNIQVTASGPFPLFEDLKFFVTGRFVTDDGFIYGRRVYKTFDNDPYSPSGDSAWVPMNNSDHTSLHGKITYQVLPSLKINYGYLWDDNFDHYYDHAYRLTPEGIMNHYRSNSNHNIIVNHTLSNSTFHTLKFAYNYSKYKGYLYENPLDLRYVNPDRGLPASAYTFRSGGNQPGRYKRDTETSMLKWDLNTQVSKQHNLGIGVIFKQHKLRNFGTLIKFRESIGIDSSYYPEFAAYDHAEYEKKPVEISTYIQDKMEYEDFIVNLGLRFDYFDPKTNVPGDIKNPHFNDLFPFSNKKAATKTQLSPRFGVAFPISSKGVIHVSYGHFFQIPTFENLYLGIKDYADGTTRFPINRMSQGLESVMGNPELDAERTTMYEAGLQQALSENLIMDFTAFYRDIRNLVDTEIIETYEGIAYARFINRDYGHAYGIVLSFEKRFSDYWGGRLDYTYQFAEGNSSDPRSVFYDNQADPPVESEKKLIPLNWDQRNTVNLSVNAGVPGDWNIGLIGRYGTGTPYSAEVKYTKVNVNFRNNRYKPSTISFDLRADKVFEIAKTRITAYLVVYNLFDTLNEYNVYGSSGRAGSDLNIQDAGVIYGLSTLEEYVINPTFYSAPRQIRIGISFGL